jgi:hypothetical protein
MSWDQRWSAKSTNYEEYAEFPAWFSKLRRTRLAGMPPTYNH